MNDEIRKQLQNIVSGTFSERQQDNCTTIRNLLCESFKANTTNKREFESKALLKKEQAGFLKAYAEKEGIWYTSLPENCLYLTRGGEAEVYLADDNKHVIKVNDGVYYATWIEFFNSIAIHNLLFPNTAYHLLGFMENEGNFSAILCQQYIIGKQAELNDIKQFLIFNGFVNTKRQDYYNSEFGLILEDMHDENVIEEGDALFFVDTVFYITG